MRSLSTAGFCKTKTCPSTETLLLYTEASLAQGKRRKITAHLSSCDFCGAEMLLLAKHAPGSRDMFANSMATTAAAVMPAPLRRLAEDLLGDMSRVVKIFAGATFEKERLTLTDA